MNYLLLHVHIYGNHFGDQFSMVHASKFCIQNVHLHTCKWQVQKLILFRNFLLNSNPVYWYIHTCHNTNSISYRNFVISHAKNWAHLHNLLIFSMYMYYKLCPHICKYLFPNASAECTCNCLKIPILTLWYLCHIHRKSIF